MNKAQEHAKQENGELRFFDAQWYLAQNPDVAALNVDALQHFMEQGWREGRNPSRHFDVKKYIETYPEILDVNMHPFWHMRFCIHNDNLADLQFPVQCQNVIHTFSADARRKTAKRAVVFAAFLRDGVIAPYILYYLRGLKKISDYIVFIADSPILPDELKKLAPFVQYVACERHKEYDFGSYKRGIQFLDQAIGLENIEELVLCNDSCIGPVVPFEEMFQTMGKRELDFWGITLSVEIVEHLQSFFLVFRNQVLKHKVFLELFEGMHEGIRRNTVIIKYELPLAKKLCRVGFRSDIYLPIPSRNETILRGLRDRNPTKAPCFLLENHSPLIKLQSLHDMQMNYEGLTKTRQLLAQYNPDLARLIDAHLEARARSGRKNPLPMKYVSKDAYADFICMQNEVMNYRANNPLVCEKFPESQIMHQYLDGLRGVEIGASSQNSFGLERTSSFYMNVDYKAEHEDFWQKGSVHTPAQVNVVALGDALPFRSDSLDYVINSYVLEHFFDPIKAVKEWFRIVKKGGYVALIVPHKDRTFDRQRAVTPLQELYDRHEGRLKIEDFAYCEWEHASYSNPLPRKYLTIIKDGIAPEGYKAIKTDAGAAHCHLSVWTTESFLDLCRAMHWNVVECHTVDDKIGNGFLCILQKL